MKTRRTFLVLLVSMLLFQDIRAQVAYHEKYRPQYHFSPLKGWTGDPDGLVKYKGVYHLFWWGHAISKDLVHWQEMPYPIKGNIHQDGINSGGAIIDTADIAGFGKNAMIGFHSIENKEQTVGISSSLDYVNLQLYPGNPVLKNHESGHDFRDPHVFWYAPTACWIMVVALGVERKMGFYSSTDLKKWNFLSQFGPDGGTPGDNWETPDMFQLPLDGDSTKLQWILTIAAGTDKMQYFIGSFDGRTFTNQQPGIELRVDCGKDFYAARTWRDFDGPRKSTTMMGWLGSWDYASHVPSKETYNGQGVESIPRDIEIRTYPEGIRLVQTPIDELKKLRKEQITVKDKTITGTESLETITGFKNSNNVYEIDTHFAIENSSAFGFNLLVGKQVNRKLVVRYNPQDSLLTVDRTHSTDADFCCKFPVSTEKKVAPVNGMLRLHIYIDVSTAEIFVNEGKVVFSFLTFPGASQTGIEIFSDGKTSLRDFSLWPLRSIW